MATRTHRQTRSGNRRCREAFAYVRGKLPGGRCVAARTSSWPPSSTRSGSLATCRRWDGGRPGTASQGAHREPAPARL